MSIPRIISVDDHLVEPPGLWQDRLPGKYRSVGPRVERWRLRNYEKIVVNGVLTVDRAEPEDADAGVVDVWLYEDLVSPMTRAMEQSGFESDDPNVGITFDQMLPAAYDKVARLKVLEDNHSDASLSFPSFSRFCGQTFAEGKDKELALLCVRAYNDFMIDDWCSGEAYGRLIPLTIVPLWDVQLAVEEVWRTANKGSHALAFTESPSALGFPTMWSGYWEPLFRACAETQTVINMHIGSSSSLQTTSADAPMEVLMSLNTLNSIRGLVDWALTGILDRYPSLKVAFSEGQVGWEPYYLHRMDQLWIQGIWEGMQSRLSKLPSQYMREQVYGCILDDPVGLRLRDLIGMSQIMAETDFPHADSTYPHSKSIIEKQVADAGLSDHETWMLVRGNAIECYGLQRWGVTS